MSGGMYFSSFLRNPDPSFVRSYSFEDLEQLRARIIGIIDDRLSEIHFIPWVPQGQEFHFMRAATVVFDTGVELHTPEDLIQQIPLMSSSTIYYHFVEARRRTPDRCDDFCAWLIGLNEPPLDLIEALRQIDFYFMTLIELKDKLTSVFKNYQ